MIETLAVYIAHYGLIVVFASIFLQEVGIPSPLPNEVVLLFAGYLASIGKLHLIPLIIVAVAGDFFGSATLYTLFYHFGSKLLAKHPKWISEEKIGYLRKKLSGKQVWSIYIARLLPYARAYTSMAAGTLKIKPTVYLPSILLSAITWSGGYVILGRIVGPAWTVWAGKVGTLHLVIGVALGAAVAGVAGFLLYKKYKSK